MKKRKKALEIIAKAVNEDIERLVFLDDKLDASTLRGYSYLTKTDDGRVEVVVLASSLSDKERVVLLKKELLHAHQGDRESPASLLHLLDVLTPRERKVDLSVAGVIIPERKTAEGVLIKAASVVWGAVVDQLKNDWTKAHDIPPHVWEEIIAGAYDMAGFDEVILTPRSGDHGRDVIAVRKGIGCIKIIGSVKAYAPGHLVSYDDVRALIGVMSGERDASKGILSTTSEFPPRIMDDPFIAPFVPYRLELMNGRQLQKWLLELVSKRSLE
jgi:restriction system protein